MEMMTSCEPLNLVEPICYVLPSYQRKTRRVSMLTAEKLIKDHPYIFHMSAPGTWPSIRKHGLLSTTALLDFFEYDEETRRKIESSRRPDWVTISHPNRSNAMIRDQKPLSDCGLRKALPKDMSPACWYEILNSMVFFFPCKERLKRMLNVYRKYRNTVLVVNTKSLLKTNEQSVYWSPINSGFTMNKNSKNIAYRDRNTFVRLGAEVPLVRGRKRSNLVEIAVKYAVHDIADHVERVIEIGGGKAPETIWVKT